MSQDEAQRSDAISKSVRVLEALDAYIDRPDREHRQAIRSVLLTEFQGMFDILAEREADRKDAERYRWLRDTGDATWRPFGIRTGYSAKCADAAIDAAIAAAQLTPEAATDEESSAVGERVEGGS